MQLVTLTEIEERVQREDAQRRDPAVANLARRWKSVANQRRKIDGYLAEGVEHVGGKGYDPSLCCIFPEVRQETFPAD